MCLLTKSSTWEDLRLRIFDRLTSEVYSMNGFSPASRDQTQNDSKSNEHVCIAHSIRNLRVIACRIYRQVVQSGQIVRLKTAIESGSDRLQSWCSQLHVQSSRTLNYSWFLLLTWASRLSMIIYTWTNSCVNTRSHRDKV